MAALCEYPGKGRGITRVLYDLREDVDYNDLSVPRNRSLEALKGMGPVHVEAYDDLGEKVVKGARGGEGGRVVGPEGVRGEWGR